MTKFHPLSRSADGSHTDRKAALPISVIVHNAPASEYKYLLKSLNDPPQIRVVVPGTLDSSVFRFASSSSSSSSCWRSGVVVSALASINEVNQRRTRLVLRWVTVSEFSSRCVTFIPVCRQPRRSTQPGHPFVGRRNEYQLSSQRAVMPCGWEYRQGKVRVWVAGKTVIPLLYADYVWAVPYLSCVTACYMLTVWLSAILINGDYLFIYLLCTFIVLCWTYKNY